MNDVIAARADQLVGRIRAGDGDAFADLVTEYGPDVLRLCMVITTDRMAAEDAAQNAWQKVWRRIGTLRDPSSLRSWLLRVAANEAKQVMRRRRRQHAESLDLSASLGPVAEPYAELRGILSSLNPDDRELLAHRYVLGLTSEEIGRHLGLSAEGVRSRLKRLRDRLQKEMTDDAY